MAGAARKGSTKVNNNHNVIGAIAKGEGEVGLVVGGKFFTMLSNILISYF